MRLILFLTLTLAFALAFGQSEADQRFWQADSLHGAGDYGAAADAFFEAANGYQAAGHDSMAIMSHLREGDNRTRNSEFNAAKQANEAANNLLRGKEKEYAELTGRLHMNRGLMGLYESQPETTIREYQQALVYLQSLPGLDYLITTCYNDLGVAAGMQGRYQEELEWYKKSLDIHICVRGEDDPEVASSYNNIGTAYYRLGDYASLDRYLKKAEAVLIQSLGESHPYMATVYNNLAFSAQLNNHLEESIEYYQKSLRIHLKKRHENHSLIAVAYNNMGDTYGKMGDHEKEIQYLQKALYLRLDLLDTMHNDVAISYQNLGHAFADSGNPERALKSHRAALSIRKNLFGDRHPEVANSLLSIGDHFSRKQQFDSAFHYLQQSFSSNSYTYQAAKPSGLPPLDQAISYAVLLEQLMVQANTWEEFSQQDSTPSALRAAVETWLHADSLVWLRRNGIVDPNGPQYLGQESRQVYEGGIRCAMKILEEEPSDEMINRLLLFMARSRAGQLWEARQISPLAEVYGLETHWLEEEKSLKARLDAAERNAREVLASNGQNSLEFANAQDSVFSIREAWESFLTRLRKAYPGFVNQRYRRPHPTLKQLSEIYAEQVLVAFFMSPDGLFRFGMNGQTIHLSHSPRQAELTATYLTVLQHLRGEKTVEQAHYLEAAQQLTDYILTPVFWELAPTEQTPIVVVPDGLIGYLPIEALSDDRGRYLAERYRIRYQYALQLPARKSSNTDLVFAGYAPKFGDEDETGIRAGLAPLTHNREEVEAISEQLGEGFIWVNENATETQFRKSAPSASILHLALHGRLNDQYPDESFLAFAVDSVHDGQLYAYEIAALDLSAELAVLSACETGSGAIQQGEGIMSLARAFLEAGCKSVLMSLWAVNDEATYEFMTRFYQFWKAGNTSIEALSLTRQAMQSETRFRDPQYWAGFVLMGESTPYPAPRARWPWILGGFILAAIAFAFYSRRTSRAS